MVELGTEVIFNFLKYLLKYYFNYHQLMIIIFSDEGDEAFLVVSLVDASLVAKRRS